MELDLKKPLVFFDIESTGLDVAKDRIIEFGGVKVSPDGKVEKLVKRINPQMPISAEATAVNHITNDDVKDAPTFKEVAQTLANWMEGCDIAGYNILKFDIPILEEEFIRSNTDFNFRRRRVIDVQNIFHRMEQRTLVAAYKFYCHKEFGTPHAAYNDAFATYEVLKAQLDRYPDTLKNDVAMLSDFSGTRRRYLDNANRIALDDNGKPVFNFGKYKGKLVLEVFKTDPGYYSWMQNGDFTADTKRVITNIRLHPDQYN